MFDKQLAARSRLCGMRQTPRSAAAAAAAEDERDIPICSVRAYEDTTGKSLPAHMPESL